MLKRRISTLTLMAIMANSLGSPIYAFNEAMDSQSAIENKVEEKKVYVEKFDLYNNPKLDEYNSIYKLDNSKIKSITNNGGRYGSSTIDKSTDNNFSTHWETGKPNSDTFTNEVVVTFDEVENLNRIVYASRQDGAKGKGFAQEVEIYSSLTEDGDDFQLVGTGSYSGSNGDIVEMKFNSTDFKRLKFVFKKANQGWASASEFMFYKEDTALDKVKTLFTDNTKSQVSAEFNTIDKINALENELKTHPMYEVYKEDIENAKILLNQKDIEATEAIVSKLEAYYMSKEVDSKYSELFRVPSSNISKITANGGTYYDSNVNYMIDENPATHWETNKNNSSNFTNELVFTFDNPEVLNRVAFLAREVNRKGFPEKFEIYASETSEGDTFQKVSFGDAQVTGDFVEFKFEPTKFKRLKFKFVKSYTDRPFVAEMRFYKEDAALDKVKTLFTDNTKSQVSAEFNTIEKINALEEELKTHPMYEVYKEDIENAKILLNQKDIEATEAIVSKLEAYYMSKEVDSKYSELFRVPSSNISKITANGGTYYDSNVNYMIDENPATHWETNKNNSSNFTNELVFTFDNPEVLNRVAFLAREVNRKGFPEKFEIYASETSEGDTFQKVSFGDAQVTGDFVEFKFEPTKFKRLKFKFVKSYTDRPFVAEMRFYKEDAALDKVKTLFTDNTMSQVSEEFNTVEKIDALENEFKTHPLYEKYKEQIQDARIILENSEVEYTTAKVSKFLQYGDSKLDAYNEEFKVKREDITSISTNGGQYAHNSIDRAIDGDVNTQWHSGKQNNSEFTNEITITLDELTTIDRITYLNKVSRGFAKSFDIYASKTSAGDTFEKISSGKADITTDNIEIKFNPTEVRRLKFVFKEGHENWAEAYEIGLYKPDEAINSMERLFTSSGMSEVSEEFNTIEKIDELEESVKNHTLYELFKPYIQEAREVVSGQIKNIKTVVVEQHGDRDAHASQNLKINFGNNHQPTGVVAMPGDTITVYVDAQPGQPLPKLVFSQQEGSWSSWGRSVQLKAGKNTIVVPKVNFDGNYKHDVTPGGPVYIVNPYTPEQQGKAPTVRFAEGVQAFPIFDKNTNEQEFIEFLKDYKKRLDEDAKKHPNVMDREMIDTVEIVADHLVITATANAAYEAYVNQGISPSKIVDKYNDHMDMLFKYQGLDGRNEKNDIKYCRENIRLAQPWAYMYAAGDHIGVQRDVMVSILSGITGWGIDHEIGHKMDIAARTVSETSNNMLPQKSSFYDGNPDKRIPFESEVYRDIMDENSVYAEGGHARSIAVFWQLEMVYPGYWAKLNSIYRENNISVNGRDDKLDKIAYYSCMALELDLTEHFERHGFPVTDATKEFAKKYQKPDKKVWYANYDYIEYEGEGFTKDPNVSVKTSKKGENIQVSFNVDKEFSDDVMGYEVYRNGELAAFTSTNSFVDKSVNYNDNVTYKVVAVDKKLNESQAVEVSSHKPEIRLQQNEITLKLREEFDPKSIVKAFNYRGEDITDLVEINSNVNVNEKGTYEIEYSVNSENIETTQTVKVNVVSDYDYLSDYNWKSVETQYGTPRRNSNIKGRVNGEIKTFQKGMGIHANGKIVYDLSNMEYDNFEALLGVDMNIASQGNSSIKFNILVDGKVVESTNVIKHADDMVYINVPVKGAKELVIEVTDAGNGNACDHAVIANPKLTKISSKPVLNIENKSYKAGEEINLREGVTAKDAEDGDLTSQVEIIGKVNNKKPGKYDVTYKVTDSEGNETIETVSVAVVNMDDYKYLTDYDWKSTNVSYAQPIKDKSISNNAIRLTGENGEVITYERGIGSHATSSITYDLSDKDYAYFTSYIGVDRQMYGSVGSVSFEVYVDGVKKFDSGLMNSKDPQKYVEVDINGAKELKLVVNDGGNGIGSDHASWGDTKLHFANPESVIEEEVVESETKKELRELVEYASTITKDMVGTTNHVDAKWNNFIDVLNMSKEALNDTNNTDEQLSSIIAFLNYSIEELQVKSVEEVVESETKKELRELVEYASTITKDMVGTTNHVDAKWNNFIDVLNMSKEALNDTNNTDEQLSSIIAFLNYSIEELQVKSVEEVVESDAKKELRKLVEYAKTITIDMVGATTHVNSRWSNFETAKNSAIATLEDDSKTDADFEYETMFLNYCISDLKLK